MPMASGMMWFQFQVVLAAPGRAVLVEGGNAKLGEPLEPDRMAADFTRPLREHP
jgi:hypothetical protein